MIFALKIKETLFMQICNKGLSGEKRWISNFLIFLFFCLGSTALAQDGVIKGRIVDAQTQEPRFGVTVIVEDIFYQEMTDEDGNFIMYDVPPGSYTVTSSHFFYETITLEGVVVKPNEVTEIELALDSEDIGLDTAEIVVRINRESETARSEEHTSELQSRGQLVC